MKKNLLSLLLVLALFSLTQAQTKYLWATANRGGAHGFGCILQSDSDGTNFHVVYSGDSINGAYPWAKLVMADNGLIYGTAGNRTIYSYNPVTQTLSTVYNCDSHPQFGQQPYGLVSGNNGKLYGMANYGGANGKGAIFSFDPASNTYTDIHDFDTLNWIWSQLHVPYQSTQLLPATDGKLYAFARNPNGMSLFSFDPANNNFTVLRSIPFAPYRSDFASTLMQASNGKIYGIGSSWLISYDPANSVFDSLYQFQTVAGYNIPAAGLAEANGKLYSILYDANDSSLVYSFDIGTASFNILPLDSNLGVFPSSNMIRLSNGKLVFSLGSLNLQSGLYSLDPNNNTCSPMLIFNNLEGWDPEGDILEASIGVANGIATPANTTFSLSPNPAKDRLLLRNTKANTRYAISNV
ncbi:MAG: C-terminal target protein, partial [Bacteroidota bacterium]|nr:C-terminal target protein [Bacteroidota bacterium]